MQKPIKTYILNQTTSDPTMTTTSKSGNTNKFWKGELYQDGTVITYWGRIGTTGQSKTYPGVGESYLLRMVDDKVKHKYVLRTDIVGENIASGPATTVNKVAVADLAAKEIAQGDAIIEKLVRDLSNANIHDITTGTTMKYNDVTGLFSTEIGVVGYNTIIQARSILNKIGKFINKNDFSSSDSMKISSDYLTLIPQNIGRNRPTLDSFCHDIAAWNKQSSILDSLEASLDMLEKRKSLPATDTKKDDPKKVWDVTFKLVDDGQEIDRVIKKFKKTSQSMHASSSLKVNRVFDCSIGLMESAFALDGKNVGNILELWHGTRIGNILSILAKGMIIPKSNESHCTGRMFGDGLYFSDQSTKSLNYATGYWSGSRENKTFMFLADVAMGKSYTPSSSGSNFPKAGYDSTFAEGKKSGVMNNEMIVYRTSQARITKLIEFK